MPNTATGQDAGTGTNDAGTGTNDAGAAGGDEGTKEFRAVTTQDDLDRIVQARLSRERAKYGDYDDLKTKASEFDKLQESQKSELQKAQDKLAKAEGSASEATITALRLEVAIEKGLTAVQAKRLVGKDKAELEADADELIASFKADDSGTTPPGRPRERLRGGGDPSVDVEESDPRKLAEGIQLY